MIKNKHNMQKSKKILIALLALLIGLSILVVLEKKNVINLYTSGSGPENGQVSDNINYDPPTEEEKQAGDEAKQQIIEKDSQEKPPNANLVIVDSSQYEDTVEVRAFVANVIEDGTCTITFSKADLSFEESVPARADASTTLCTTLNVPRSQFSESGTWDIKISYISENYTGTVTGKVTVE